MISILNDFSLFEQQLDTFQPGRPEARSASRLDIQRRHLEYKKMNYLHEAMVRDRANDIERTLRRRAMIAETRLTRSSASARIRRSVGQALISVGERIRPELV
ncbi:hypothetical protein BH20CHL3_BH20CHL3_09550 [soil metagenome]